VNGELEQQCGDILQAEMLTFFLVGGRFHIQFTPTVCRSLITFCQSHICIVLSSLDIRQTYMDFAGQDFPFSCMLNKFTTKKPPL